MSSKVKNENKSKIWRPYTYKQLGVQTRIELKVMTYTNSDNLPISSSVRARARQTNTQCTRNHTRIFISELISWIAFWWRQQRTGDCWWCSASRQGYPDLVLPARSQKLKQNVHLVKKHFPKMPTHIQHKTINWSASERLSKKGPTQTSEIISFRSTWEETDINCMFCFEKLSEKVLTQS